jgi:hypothetical protein
MKIKRFQDFSINESFGISRELNDFIRSKSLDWSDFEDSLWDIKDDSDFELKKSCELVDENGHTINVELEGDKQYKLLYKLSIQFLSKKTGTLAEFKEIQSKLSIIIDSIEPMISRVSEKGLKLKKNDYLSTVSNELIKYRFDIQFESDTIKKEELDKVYSDYLNKSKFTPEFQRGIKQLTDYYKRQSGTGIDLQKYLDYNIQEDIIMVGFVTEDDIYGIGEYDNESKTFTIDWGEVEASIEWYIEEDFNYYYNG